MYKQTTTIYQGSKMSELIIAYPDMITVLERLNIEFGFGDQSVREIAARHKINLQAFVSILQIFEGSIRQAIVLEKESISDILHFLKASHRYFKSKQIPNIKDLIVLFAESIPSKHGKMIISFFDEYMLEVNEHFHYEDEEVFLYIESIISNPVPKSFKITEFEKNHTDIEQKLLDLKNILIKYIPEEIISDYRLRILRRLIYLERDLAYHTFIEDLLLIPSIKQLERQLNG